MKGKQLIILTFALSIVLFCTQFSKQGAVQALGAQQLPVSILQYRATPKNIIPTFFFFSVQQDTSQKPPVKPTIDPIPENDPGQPQGHPDADPSSTSPTWVQMIGAIVNVFLSLYQSF